MDEKKRRADLVAFERRLKEVIRSYKPQARRWTCLVIVISLFTAIGIWTWATDPETAKVSFLQSLWNHPFFIIIFTTLVGLFAFGVHLKCLAPVYVASQARKVLCLYSMTCDDEGNIVLINPHYQV